LRENLIFLNLENLEKLSQKSMLLYGSFNAGPDWVAQTDNFHQDG
jgi:hypothetical protein